jgi:hypothetical protein
MIYIYFLLTFTSNYIGDAIVKGVAVYHSVLYRNVKKAVLVVKKVFKNPLVQQALNEFGKFMTSDKKSVCYDTLNKTTRVVEDTYNTFIKKMDNLE